MSISMKNRQAEIRSKELEARPAMRSLYRVTAQLKGEPLSWYVVTETPEQARKFCGLRDDFGAVSCIAEVVEVVGVDAAHEELPPLPISVLPGVPPTPSFDPLHDDAKFAAPCAGTTCDCAAPICKNCGKARCWDQHLYPGWHGPWICPECCQQSGFSRWQYAEGK